MNQPFKRTCAKCGERALVDTSQDKTENRCLTCGNNNAFNFAFRLNHRKPTKSSLISNLISKTSKPAR